MRFLRPSALIHLGLALAVGSLAASRIARRVGWSPAPVDIDLVPGEAAGFDDGSAVVLKKFTVERWPNGKPRQYVSDVHLVLPPAGSDAKPAIRNASISVNHPLRFNGWWVYQSSYGESAPGEYYTVLKCVRDPTLPFAAAGAILLVAGALWFAVARTRRPVDPVAAPAAPARRRGRLAAALPYAAAAALSLLPAYFIGRSVLKPDLMPALQSPFLFPHILAYLFSYVIMLFAAFGLLRRLLPAAFFLMTLGLALGATWGKICWSEWWQFDPKEMWSFFTWLAYGCYFHVPRLCRTATARRRLARALLVLGAVLVILTLTWVNFSRMFSGVHSYA